MPDKPKIIITGITGQDGAYLAKLLLKKGYAVVGILRSSTKNNLSNLDYLGIKNQITFVKCDLLDINSLEKVIVRYAPRAIYNLAAQSSVGLSFSNPFETINFNTISVLNILETIKKIDKKIRFYQASSSEMYGSINKLPILENSTLNPVSPYGISKASAHWICVHYRESYGIFTTSGILFNHESILRSDDFFIKKVIKTAIDIKHGQAEVLEVGNIDIKRDFGYAPSYVESMYLMMQEENPDDYIICSGKSIRLREIIYYVFDKLKINKNKIIVNETYYRPNEIQDIYGNPSKAREKLKWNYDTDFFSVLDILIREYNE